MSSGPRHLARTAVLVAALAVLASCGSPGAPVSSPSVSPSSGTVPTGSEVETLPTGKDDLALAAGRYRSPDGFNPELVVTVDDGWTSVHRGNDGFDLGRSADPDDALLVAVAFLVPPEASADSALDNVRDRAGGSPTSVTASVGGLEADGIDVDGGTGQLVAGAAAGIALDAMPDGRVRVLAVDVNGASLVVAVVVPDRSRWDQLWPEVQAVLQGAEFG